VTVKGLYIFPLPRGARDTEVRIQGHKRRTETLGSQEGFERLRRIVVQTKDSSLLEHIGGKLLIIDPVVLAAGKQKTISVEFRIPGILDSGHMDIPVTLAGERHALGPVGELLITVRFKTSQVVRNLLSPTHEFEVFRESPYRLIATVSEKGRRIKSDFSMVAMFTAANIGLKVLTNPQSRGAGAFLAFVSAPLDQGYEIEGRKEIVLIIDTSGSLTDRGLKTAKQAALLILGKLRGSDRFNVVEVGVRAKTLWPESKRANKKNLRAALELINGLKKSGGTDLYNGLIISAGCFASRAPTKASIVITDGKATVGPVTPKDIIKGLDKANRKKARHFALAMGPEPNMALLDKMVLSTGGACILHDKDGDLESTVDQLFLKISPPTLSHLSLEFEGLDTRFIVPEPIPDLYPSETALILGKYELKGGGPRRVKLKAKMEGEYRVVTESFPNGGRAFSRPHITRLWAMGRLAMLMEKLWFSGPDPLVGKKIMDLARAHGLPALESAQTDGPGTVSPNVDERLGALIWKLKRSTTVTTVAAKGYKYVDGKVFKRREGRWMDIAYKNGPISRRLTFLSDEYFNFLRDNMDLAAFFALDSDVTVMKGNKAIGVYSTHEN
jgi:Ca-activated chloride channel family protein